ncbi:hypothetical protein BHE97_00580 [Aeromicrobium sp. PE09-221]|uniref:hypothetical protein n=1 Tax=Aeromicrobium sp. PE09-221 TaxID=1898043 RepID=UPI000B3E7751|nr:hypothetical protein [Aeromicrobium sp. PE09-221]OUZ12742.1 hypothetical protein BHE97_00580 [Aeromicrobium sp. PE09-221]
MTDETARGVNVLVVADPGLPSRRVDSIKDELRTQLETTFSPPVELYTQTETIRLRPDNSLDFDVASRIAEKYERIDVVLLLTEIPRHRGSRPLIAEIFPDEKVGVISCPTLGAVTTKRRILTVLMACALRLVPVDGDLDPDAHRLRWGHWGEVLDESGHRELTSNQTAGGLRMVLGMTMANDPWRTAPRLSSALAAASATGAFGIFYNSIWQMSNYLSTARLLLIGLLAMTVMVAWLIVSNRLWDKPVQERLSTVVLLYNLSTIATLFLCVLVLYAVLVVLILLTSLVVIDPEFMSVILDQDASFVNYLDIAWLSAAMGVVAGGLGSSFDSETDLRRLTHGQRERQRRYSEDEDDSDQDTISS